MTAVAADRKGARPNYLDLVPTRADLAWSADGCGLVTLHKENNRLLDRAAQKLLHKPRVSHIHLDERGSFVWPRIDGQRTVGDLARLAAAQFGLRAEAEYPRMAEYIRILASYGFVTLAPCERR